MIEQQLQRYLDLGLTPIPLKGKKPVVKWTQWHPKIIDALKPYIRGNANWGVATGGNLAVLDFDSEDAYVDFVSRNIDLLCGGYPVVKTGRGFHIWFKPIKPLKSHQFAGVDLKGEGGYVVCPPSIHPGTGRRYIWHHPLSDIIPELDLDKLDLGGIADKSYAGIRRTVSQEPADPWALEDGFDASDIDSGVPEGRRHDTLVKYVGLLVAQDTPVQDIFIKVTAWNRLNTPPLEQHELETTTVSCLASFMGRPVPVSTLRSSDTRVLLGTDDYRKPVAPDEWEPEACAPWFRVVRKEHVFHPVAMFCGRWDCPRCGAFYKRRWIGRITRVTEGLDVHTMEIDQAEWSCFRRRFSKGRLDLEYARIAHGDKFTLIIGGPCPGARKLPREELDEFLKSIIPDRMPLKAFDEKRPDPVTVSRSWKTPMPEYTGKMVAKTKLPIPHQVEVARSLGASIHDCGDTGWNSPVDEDPGEWGEKLAFELKLREVLVGVGMKRCPQRARDIWEGRLKLTEVLNLPERVLSPSAA